MLKYDTIYGKTGDTYKTSEIEANGLVLEAMTGNTEGVFTDLPIYVIYSYAEPEKQPKEKNILPALLVAAGSAAILGALGIFVAYRKKKKRMIK